MRKSFIVLLLISLLFSLLLAACGDATSTQPMPTSVVQKQATTTTVANPTSSPSPLPTATSTLSKGTLAQVFPQLASLPDIASSIEIGYDWGGLSDFNPVKGSFTIERTNNQFTGIGQFSIEVHPLMFVQNPDLAGSVFSNTVNTLIPFDHIQKFLQGLTQIPLEEGPYTPYIGHTDDYPSWVFSVSFSSNNVLEVYSQSQLSLGLPNSGYAPWGVRFAGRNFVVNSAAPYQAYQNIAPDLQIDEQIKKVEQQAESITVKPSSIATPIPTSPPVPTAKPTVAKGTMAQVFPQLAKLTDIATAINIDYSWDTLAQSIRTQLTLKRNNNQFEGSGVYKLGAAYTGGNGVSSNANITIPADHAQRFLQGLTQIPLVEGPYTAYFQHTDDYITIAFSITLSSGETLKVYTNSQDAFDPNTGKMVSLGNVPWAVEFQGRTFVVNTNAAYQAYQNIYPDLQIDEQIKKLEQSNGNVTP